MQAHNVADLLDKERVCRQLEDLRPMRLQSKGSPYAAVVLRLRPERASMERVPQCVASFDVVSRVSVTTLETSASVTVRGLPGLGSSTSPSGRLSKNRDLHLPTVALETLNSAATAVFVLPLEHSNAIRARWANACAVLGLRAHCPVAPFHRWSASTVGLVDQDAYASSSHELSGGYQLPNTNATNFRDSTLGPIARTHCRYHCCQNV